MSGPDEETVNGADYTVGFRRPPLHTRFKPGVSPSSNLPIHDKVREKGDLLSAAFFFSAVLPASDLSGFRSRQNYFESRVGKAAALFVGRLRRQLRISIRLLWGVAKVEIPVRKA
jgi:hypothetical protein